MAWVLGATPEIDAASQWRAIMATTLVFTIIMLFVVALRFWVRRRALHKEDWITLVTMLSSCIYSTSVIVQTRYGLGLPVPVRPPEAWKTYALTSYASRPFYLWGIAGFKLALCISYLRMTQGSPDRRYRFFIIAVAAFSTFAQTVFIVLYVCQCIPISKAFSLSTAGTCLPFAPVNYTISVTTITSDVIIFLLPIPLIYRLHLDRAVKAGLTVIFSLGLITTVLSIMRATQIYRVAYVDGDATYFVIRSGLELNIGIITSCLPVLRPVLRHVPQKLISILTLGGDCCFLLHRRRRHHNPSTISEPRMPGYQSATHTIGGSYKPHHSTTTQQSSRRWGIGSGGGGGGGGGISTHPLRMFDKSIDRMLVPPRRDPAVLLLHHESPLSRSTSTQSPTKNRFSLAAKSVQSDGSASIMITGGGGGGGGDFGALGPTGHYVVKTTDIEVASTTAPSPTDEDAAAGGGAAEFGRGRTRRDDWEEAVSSPPLSPPLSLPSGSRAGSRAASWTASLGRSTSTGAASRTDSPPAS